MALTAAGAQVKAVADGEEAVKEALGHAFDLILMDVRMGGMDGLTATAELRRRGHVVGSETEAIFAVDAKTGRRLWTYHGKNIMHVTIAIGDGRMFFIESSISRQEREALLRQDKTELKKLTGEAAKRKEAELKRMDVRMAVALDAKTGERLWARPVDVTDCSGVSAGGGNVALMYADNR